MTKEMVTLAERIDAAYGTDRLDTEQIRAVHETIHLLDTGQVRVCEKRPDGWHTHQWLKKAILLYFRIQKPEVVESGAFHFCDKIPVKSWNGTEGVRVVPQALARRGSFVEPGCILMPSFVNIGAYVGAGSMIDTWVTVGSCAQIGKNVHLAGGVGVGGAIELRGAVPANAVAIPGATRRLFPAGEFGVPCVLIIGTRGESTDKKTSLTAALREFDIRA